PTKGLLRLADLNAHTFSLTTFSVSGNPDATDLSLSTTLSVHFGSTTILSQPLTLVWADVTHPLNVTINGFDPFKNLNQKIESAVLAGLQKLVDVGTSINQSSLLQTRIDLIHGTIGDYLQLGDAFKSHLYTPIQTYFNSLASDEFPTVQGLADA